MCRLRTGLSASEDHQIDLATDGQDFHQQLPVHSLPFYSTCKALKSPGSCITSPFASLRLSGFMLPSPIVSSGSILALWFTTDFAVSAQGFKAVYEVCHAQFSFWFSRVSLPLKSVGPSLQSEPHCIGHGCQCWLPVDRWSIETKIISWMEEELLLKKNTRQPAMI
ncbi:hypothetical protein F7725_026199 [Dissostichus mawsoni]|uniref:Uncharacterized protein n=1 Tax=Dissostichus mawsoni TaxID=36200 RepID=A0A7J5X6C3_DISMA|nr:hypothetical protein F7725_026199 [Dissostichus mawsoni]